MYVCIARLSVTHLTRAPGARTDCRLKSKDTNELIIWSKYIPFKKERSMVYIRQHTVSYEYVTD